MANVSDIKLHTYHSYGEMAEFPVQLSFFNQMCFIFLNTFSATDETSRPYIAAVTCRSFYAIAECVKTNQIHATDQLLIPTISAIQSTGTYKDTLIDDILVHTRLQSD